MTSSSNLKDLVSKSPVKISVVNERIKVSAEEVKGCEYAFYLLKNNIVEEKVFYSEKVDCKFDSKIDFNNFYCAKVFYKKDKEKIVKLTKSIKPFKEFFQVNSYINDFSLEDCEISSQGADKIKKYETIGFQPRADCKPVKLTLPINWLDDPLGDRNWMYQLNAWRMLDAYIVRFLEEDRFFISEVINDWVSFEKSNTGSWLWYDMSTGLRALKISYYLKKCNSMGVSHNIDDVSYLISMHFKHLSNPEELNAGNHGLFQLNGLKALIFVCGEFQSSVGNTTELSKYALEKMDNLIFDQLGTEGVHTEHSPDYHFFVHRKLSAIINAPWWGDIDKKILDLINKSEYAKPWFLFPNGKCVPIGDSSSGSTLKPKENIESWPHTKAGKYIGAKLDGYAVVRSQPTLSNEDSSFLFFQGAFNSHVHKHSDDLSFILQEGGVNMLIDSGKYGYQQNKYRKYFLSTPAHNTITVDGVSTSRNRKNAYGSAIQEEPKCYDNVWLLKGGVDHIENEYSHKRIIFYRPGWDVYIVDVVENKSDKKTREISQWWHFDTDAEVDIVKNELNNISANIVREEASRSFSLHSFSNGEKSKIEKYKGYDDIFLAGWVSKSYLKYEPTACVKVSSQLKDIKFTLTKFVFKKGLPALINYDGETFAAEKPWILRELNSFVGVYVVNTNFTKK